MIHTTIWSPDTCGCKVAYDWDDAVPAESRVHTFNRIETSCPEHSGLSGSQFLVVMLGENQRKNDLRKEILERITEVSETKQNPDGSTYLDFKQNIAFDYSFTGVDDKRVLEISIQGYTLKPSQRTLLQNLANSKYGIGKVIIL